MLVRHLPTVGHACERQHKVDIASRGQVMVSMQQHVACISDLTCNVPRFFSSPTKLITSDKHTTSKRSWLLVGTGQSKKSDCATCAARGCKSMLVVSIQLDHLVYAVPAIAPTSRSRSLGCGSGYSSLNILTHLLDSPRRNTAPPIVLWFWYIPKRPRAVCFRCKCTRSFLLAARAICFSSVWYLAMSAA